MYCAIFDWMLSGGKTAVKGLLEQPGKVNMSLNYEHVGWMWLYVGERTLVLLEAAS